MEQSVQDAIKVSNTSSVSLARQRVRAVAEELGFQARAREEIVLAVTELGTNLLKHAKGGVLTLTRLEGGIQIEASDSGPGIRDVEEAMTDGFSTAGGMGGGLGAANRLMDEFTISSERGEGTHIVCRKWLRGYASLLYPCPVAIGVATRPHPRFDVNGDAFVIRQWEESVLVGVIDGLGHGPGAFDAAQTARQYVETHFDLPLEDLFCGTGRSCRKTRGVVMALARLDWGLKKFLFASIGDIEFRVQSRLGPSGFSIRRGIVGLNAPAAVVTEHPWDAETLLLLHSDGAGSHWRWNDFPGILRQPADAIAHRLLLAMAKNEDDATVLVVKNKGP